jgi:hypothetical protein
MNQFKIPILSDAEPPITNEPLGVDPGVIRVSLEVNYCPNCPKDDCQKKECDCKDCYGDDCKCGQGSCYALNPTTNLIDDHRSSVGDRRSQPCSPIGAAEDKFGEDKCCIPCKCEKKEEVEPTCCQRWFPQITLFFTKYCYK